MEINAAENENHGAIIYSCVTFRNSLEKRAKHIARREREGCFCWVELCTTSRLELFYFTIGARDKK